MHACPPLTEAARRLVAAWAADCTERALPLLELAAPGHDAASEELAQQLDRMSQPVRTALGRLPPVGADASGPLGSGLLSSGALGQHIRALQAALESPEDGA